MQEPSTDTQQERVQEIPLSELHPFEGHPFRVADDEDMEKTVESIKEYGVLTPAIVRPDPYGGYEIISGHRRHHASGLAGKETMPAIVRDMDDDAAIILLVDSNLHRENILPSERAYAYRMKLDAIRHQGKSTSSQVGMKSNGKQSLDVIGEQMGASRNQIHRYIRLTELIPQLLDMVDEKKLAFNPAVEISYGTNYQKLGKDLASVDELAVLDGGKCILQLRGVRPFLSDKYDLTQHPNYKYTSDYDKKNEFNIEQFLSRRLKLKANDEFVVVESE